MEATRIIYIPYTFITDLLLVCVDDCWVPPNTVAVDIASFNGETSCEISSGSSAEIIPTSATVLNIADIGYFELRKTAGAELALYRFVRVCSGILVNVAE